MITNIKPFKTTFAYYGLDKDKNFLQAPICECGCGNYMDIILNDDDDVGEFMHVMLDEYECNYCAIFAVKRDDMALMGVKTDGGICMYKCKIDGQKKNLFSKIQEVGKFHCYGLLEQVDEKSYRIIMD